MKLLPVALILAFASCVWAAEPSTKPARRSGPSAASLATPYSGPLKFSNRSVLAAERNAGYITDPVARAAQWRYHYAYPRFYNYYGGYGGWGWGGGWYGRRPFFRPFTTIGYHGEF